MTDLHHTLSTAAALAASGACWFCGAPCAGARCADHAACFARQLALPGEPPRPCLCGGKGYHASPDEDDPVEVYCACAAGAERARADGNSEEEDQTV